MKNTIDWQNAPKLKGMVLVGHSYSKHKIRGYFGQWVYVSSDSKILSFMPSPYFTPDAIDLKKKRFVRYGKTAKVKP